MRWRLSTPWVQVHIDQCAPADHLALRLEYLVHRPEECGGQVAALEEMAEALDGGGIRDAGGAEGDARKRPVTRDAVQRLTGHLVGEREPLLQRVDPRQQYDRVRQASRGPPWGEGGNPGDEGVSRDNGEHLLHEGRPARALGGSFETVREAQLVHATMIPATAQTPLPLAVNP